MVKTFGATILVLAAGGMLIACSTDTSDLQAQSLAHWKSYCASKGKQFLWRDTDVAEDPLQVQVKVEGKCVGPGDRGYLPPEPPEDQP
jgi:hypothetical protein